MNYLKFGLFFFISSFALAQEPVPEIPVEQQISQKEIFYQPIVEANNAFAFQLYQRISPDNGNICIAPYGVFTALGIIHEGADGITKAEIGEVIKIDLSKNDFYPRYAQLNKILTYHPSSFPEDFQLSIANSLWIQSSFPVLPSYLEFIDHFYRGDLRKVDFIKQPETAKVQINRWVKDQTQGRISDIVQSQDLSDVRMMIVTAQSMRARWQQGFDQRITKNTPFFPENRKIVSIPMMTQTSRFNYLQTDELTLLEMPYIKMKSSDVSLSFVILLPKEVEGLEKLEKLLNPSFFQNHLLQATPRQVIASIPKFKIANTFSLKEALEQMGMKEAFTEDADFSNITGSKDLKVGKVAHKTYLNVDEKGTEAASATSVEMMVTSTREDPILFRADHPFMYFIVDRFTNTLLFMGKYTSPLEK